MGNKIAVVVNASSGTPGGEALIEELRAGFIEAGANAEFFVADGGDIERLAKRACESDADIIVAAGGDGTVSAVASCVVDSGKILGVLPLGTLNNFSKDLAMPQDLQTAIAVICGLNIAEIDVGEMNGRIFVNNSSIGIYPRMVKSRERQQRLGRGKWRSAAWAAWRAIGTSPLLKMTLTLDGQKFQRKTPFVFVGNNEYDMDLYNIGRRKRLDAGSLSVYLLHTRGRAGMLLIFLRTLFGRLKQAKDFEALTATELTISTSRKKRLRVAFDGEVDTSAAPLCYKIRKRALRVIVPESE